jgi:hypothetical protein
MTDWADHMADELMLDAIRLKYADSRELIAAKLRLLHKRGEDTGLRDAAAAVGVTLPTHEELAQLMREENEAAFVKLQTGISAEGFKNG